MKTNVGVISNENYVRIRCLLLLRLCERLLFSSYGGIHQCPNMFFFLCVFCFFLWQRLTDPTHNFPAAKQINLATAAGRPRRCHDGQRLDLHKFNFVPGYIAAFYKHSHLEVEVLSSRCRKAERLHWSMWVLNPPQPPLFFFLPLIHFSTTQFPWGDPRSWTTIRERIFFFFSLFQVFNLTAASGIIVISHICGIRGALRSHPINSVTFWRIPW